MTRSSYSRKVQPDWDIAVPRVTRLPGVRLAAFTGRSTEPVDLPMVPFPAVTLFLDFGDAAVVARRGDTCVQGMGVVGIGAGLLSGRAHSLACLQVRLSPTLAYAVFGGAVDQLAGRAIELGAVWGGEAERLRERLGAQRNWDDRFALVESALIRRSARARRVDAEVAEVWRRVSLAQGRVRVERLADQVGWTRKRLWSRFRAQVGMTPKRVAQLVRFDHAAHLLAGGLSAAEVAAETGYADQSHLHRDSTAFAGLTPAAVAAAPWLRVDPIAWGVRVEPSSTPSNDTDPGA